MARKSGPIAGRRKQDGNGADLAALKRLEHWAVATTQQLIDLTLDKVIAHHEEPRRHPLPADPQAPERRLHAIFDALPRRRQRQIADALKSRLAGPARAARYGALAAVDLEAATPVLTQARAKVIATRPPLDPAVRKRLDAHFAQTAEPRASNAPQRLVLRLDSIQCTEKTKELFEGRDELGIQALGFDETGILSGSPVFDNFFDLGKFEQGQTKPQSGRELGAFAIDPAALPNEQGFRVVLAIAELDRVLAKKPIGDAVLAFFFVMLSLAVALVLVGITGGGPTILMIIWAIYGAFVPYMMQFMSITRDDVFEVQSLSTTIVTGAETFEPETVFFSLSEGLLKLIDRFGRYQATVRFALE